MVIVTTLKRLLCVIGILSVIGCASTYTSPAGQTHTLKRGFLVGSVEVEVQDAIDKKTSMKSKGWWAELPCFSLFGAGLK